MRNSPSRVLAGHELEKRQEFDVGVLWVAFAQNFSGGDLHGGEQAGRFVPVIVVRTPRGHTGGEWKPRLGSFQGLDLGLLGDAEHHRVPRRVQIPAHHIRDLRFQFRIGGEFEGLHPMRRPAPCPPDRGSLGVADPAPPLDQFPT
jgi:hypothetical protein